MPEQTLNTLNIPPINVYPDLMVTSGESRVYIKNNNGIVDQVLKIQPRENVESVIDIEYTVAEQSF